MIAKVFPSVACLLTVVLSMALPVKASYIPPEELESYWFLSSSWKFSGQHGNQVLAMPDGQVRASQKQAVVSDEPVVEVRQNDRVYRFPVDVFMLAHFTNSDSICTGDYRSTMAKYMSELQESAPKKVMIRLSVLAKNGPLKVTSIRPFDSKRSWDRAIQEGSHILNLSAEKVRTLKSADGYEAALMKQSLEQWSLIESRPKH